MDSELLLEFIWNFPDYLLALIFLKIFIAFLHYFFTRCDLIVDIVDFRACTKLLLEIFLYWGNRFSFLFGFLSEIFTYTNELPPNGLSFNPAAAFESTFILSE